MDDDLSGMTRAADKAVLERLIEEGDSLDQPRHTVVYFYRMPEDKRDPELVLNPLAQRLSAAGWQIVDLRADAVIAESYRPADPQSIDQMAAFMGALAGEFGIDFDGWECAFARDPE